MRPTSAVCYALGVTNADAVSLGLLFERFLSPERDGPPDIDIDIESDRREEVIQYLYEKHGRHHTAQVANVITYRKSAIRDMAKALGVRRDSRTWSKRADGWGTVRTTRAEQQHHGTAQVIPHRRPGDAGRGRCATSASTPADGHLRPPGHRGVPGRVGADGGPLGAAVGQGRLRRQPDSSSSTCSGSMLSALHYAVDLVRESTAGTRSTWRRSRRRTRSTPCSVAPTPSACSRSSRGRRWRRCRVLKPRRFYDLVVEVALIRPPIQGGSVHPYIRRRNGQEPITYLHPLLENSLGKTLGVPLFQEQLMQMAIDVAGFTPAESDELRQAMGSKRSAARMERLKDRLYAGMRDRGITGDIADELYVKMKAFANYGFPESHSVSFAYLVRAVVDQTTSRRRSAPRLLNAQPMGFWSPHTLVRDARRHGVVVHTPDLNAPKAKATLEPLINAGRSAWRRRRAEPGVHL